MKGNSLLDRVAAIQKVSSPDYLKAVFAAWRGKTTVVAADHPDRIEVPGVIIEDRKRVGSGGGWFDEELEPDSDPVPAQISFTSGTTGTPKPILLSRRALSDVTVRLLEVMELERTVREYVGVPVTFSFGLGRARAVAAVGGRSFLPPDGFRPTELADMLARGEVNALSAVPTMLRLLFAQAHLFQGCGGRLKWLEIGSQPMSGDEKKAIRDIFPEARIVQHYGLTEASRSTFLDIGLADDRALESVGKPNGQVEVRVNGNGQICIRGPHVADGLLTPGGLVPLIDEHGWFETSDLGAVDEQGFLHFRGRSDDVLNIGGIKVPLDYFEQNLLRALPSAKTGLAASGLSDPLRGEALMVAYEPAVDPQALREAVIGVAQGLGLSMADVSLVPVAAIPRTETGKIRRRVLAQAGSGTETRSAVTSVGDIRKELAAILNYQTIDSSASYVDLGGDSLTYVQTSLLLEDKLGYLPKGWETLSIEELERLAVKRSSAPHQPSQSMDSHIVLRALAICWVVLNHATPGQIGGGAFLLLVLAGALFARFQHRRFISGQIVRGPAPFIVRLLVVYYLVLIGCQLLVRDVDMRHWLLVSNFWPSLQSWGILGYYWFILAFVQIAVLYTLLFAAPEVRRQSKIDPWRTGFAIMLAGFVVALVGRLALSQMDVYAELVEGRFFYRTPIFLFYIFAFGWCLHFTETKRQRVWMSLSALLTFPLIGVLSFALWLVLGSLIAIWVPRIWVPRVSRWLISAIAAASFYIFLVHMVPMKLIWMLAPDQPWLLVLPATFVGIIAGLVVAVVFRAAEQHAYRLLRRSATIPFSAETR